MAQFLAVGSGYAVSAGLVIYADQNGLVPVDLRLPVILVWAIFGVLLSLIAAVTSRGSS